MLPEAEEKRLRKAAEAALAGQARLEKEADRLRAALQAEAEAAAEARARAARAREELVRLDRELDRGLAARGFADARGAPDRGAFLAARLEDDERARLEREAKALDDLATSLGSLRAGKERELSLARGKAAAVTRATLEEELAEAARLEEERAGLLGMKGAASKELEADEKARADAARLRAMEGRQRLRHDRYRRLSDLIGHREGSRYRDFAQGLAFDRLASNASSQLTRIDPRYILVQDPQRALEFAVVDNYQGCVQRPVSTLSGGESFKVSLALALGLSAMASRNFRVESLFLDEGFGSLDEESLDAALNALAELPGNSGKTVGLISHVAALKDRINTTISVVPVGNGISVLRGPGCREISPGEIKQAADGQ
jgi:exonuclease SbcC